MAASRLEIVLTSAGSKEDADSGAMPERTWTWEERLAVGLVVGLGVGVNDDVLDVDGAEHS